MNQSFKNEITQLINKYSIDAEANTPDYILADAVAKALGRNCTIEIIKAEPQHKQKNRKKKNHGKETKV